MKSCYLATCFVVFAGAAAFADDRQSIIGVWVGRMPGDAEGTIKLTITPAKISGRNPKNGRSLGEGPYELDAAVKTIDATRLIGKSTRGKRYLGIYALTGNSLKWCATSRTSRRPAELVHRPGKDEYLMVLERRR